MRFALLLLLPLAACVERKLLIKTEPPGAMIRVNGKKEGKAPRTWPFEHYGTILVEAELEGHEPVQQEHRLRSPWWQKEGINVFTDAVWPGTIHDNHELVIKLVPRKRLTDAERKRRLNELERAARRQQKRVERLEHTEDPPSEKKVDNPGKTGGSPE